MVVQTFSRSVGEEAPFRLGEEWMDAATALKIGTADGFPPSNLMRVITYDMAKRNQVILIVCGMQLRHVAVLDDDARLL